ncbi:MAG: hypothetical protein ABR570_17595 [Burkholderiales bacterium]
MRFWLTIVASVLALVSVPSRAQWNQLHFADPRLNWRTLETEHFEIHFAEHYRAQAQTIAGIAERIYVRTTALLDWQPRRRTQLVVLDSADFANGFATPVPFNLTGIFLSPPDAGELLQNREWLELVLSHEFFHVVHLDKASGAPLRLRDVLGRQVPFFPNVLEPGWIVEGLAVYHESEAARSYGRLEHSYYEGMMRAEVDRGLRSLREVNAEGRGFPLNRDYLYGSYFFRFMAERYGEGSLRSFIDTYSSSVVPFKIQSNAIATTGKGMDALWVEYHDWLRQRVRPLASPPLSGEVLLRAFSVSSPVLTASGTRWYVQADGYTRPRIMRQMSGGAPRAVRLTEAGTRLAADGAEGVLASEQEICANHNLFYDLHRIDERGQRHALSRCQRYRFAAAMAAGQTATVRVEAGRAAVVVLDGAGRERLLYEARPAEAISGLAAAGERVVITALRDGIWALLDVSDGNPRQLMADDAVKHSPRFGDSADEVFFVADYGRRYDVWSWRGAGARLARWTRSAYGVREISAPIAGEFLLTTLEADGVALRSYRLPATALEERPAERAAGAPTAASEPITLPDRPYSAWRTLRPTAWAPLVQIADGAVALGAVVYGIDALELHQYFLAPLVEITQGELLGHAEYLYDGRHGLLGDRTLTVRATEPDGSVSKIKAYSVKEDAQWISLWRSLALNQRWYWGGGAAIGEERFHDLTAGSFLVRNERVVGLVGGVDSRRVQPLSEGPSEGQELRLFAETSRGLGAAFSGNVYRADWRGHVPLGKTVLALRWNEAYGEREAKPFELGGSKSDEVILLPVLNEREFALRGYTVGTPLLTGHRARVTTVEWRAPLADIDRHLVVPPVGMNRLALNLFFDLGAAWEHGDAPQYHRGVGAELMSEPRFGYLFWLELRAGIAKGLDATGSTKIYLRAGRSF